VVSDDDQFCPSCGAWIDPTTDTTDEGNEYEEFSLEEGPPAAEHVRPPVQVAPTDLVVPVLRRSQPGHQPPLRGVRSQTVAGHHARRAPSRRPGHCRRPGSHGDLRPVVRCRGDRPPLQHLHRRRRGPGRHRRETSTTTTTTIARVPEPINILSADCSISGLSGFECRNLINGEREYQINWEALGEDDVVTIDLIFPEPMVVTGFVWENLPADSDRFYQNYRARSISLSTDAPNSLPLAHELDDEPGLQAVEYVSLRTLSLRIQVNTVYLPEERNGRVFTELAIGESMSSDTRPEK
jgi:hypothetical protein